MLMLPSQGTHFENRWIGNFSDHFQHLLRPAITCPVATYNNSLCRVSEYIVCGGKIGEVLPVNFNKGRNLDQFDSGKAQDN